MDKYQWKQLYCFDVHKCKLTCNKNFGYQNEISIINWGNDCIKGKTERYAINEKKA